MSLIILHPIIGLLVIVAILAPTAYLLPKIIRLLIVGFRHLKATLLGSSYQEMSGKPSMRNPRPAATSEIPS